MARTLGSTSSLDLALVWFGVDPDNIRSVRAMCERANINLYTVEVDRIVADRTNGQPPLRIAPGWTNGFVSESEATELCGTGQTIWESERARGMWGVSHPKNWGSSSGGVSKGERDYGSCPACGYALPATGKCDDC